MMNLSRRDFLTFLGAASVGTLIGCNGDESAASASRRDASIDSMYRRLKPSRGRTMSCCFGIPSTTPA